MNQGPEKHSFSVIAEKLIGAFRGIPDEDTGKMRKRPTQNIHDLIEKIQDKYQIGRESPQRILLEHWEEIVGSANALYSHPREISTRGVLIVSTAHPVVRNELFHNRNMILKRIKALPGCSTIRSVRVVSS